MPALSYLAVEAVAFGFALAVGYQAWKEGARKLTTLLVAMGFGFAIELFFVSVYTGYSYGDFLVDFPLGEHTVPLWVAAGWGTIIYISMEATDRMGLPWYVAPVVDGLLAVSLDVTLDPVADALGWWDWSRVGQFFGVPYDNFIGWVLIVASYSFFSRAGFQLWKKETNLRDILVPILALMPAIAAVAGAQVGLEKVFYPWLGEPHTFALLVVLLALLALPSLRKAMRSGGVPWFLWVIPASYHGLMLALVFTTGISSESPDLILFMLVAPVASLALFTYSR